MKMPSGLIVHNQKLTEYLLVYQENDDKSGYLALAGYTNENWQLLKRDILKAVEGAEIEETTSTSWGTRFKVKRKWKGLNGKQIRVVTIWQQDIGADDIRFVTLYPDKS